MYSIFRFLFFLGFLCVVDWSLLALGGIAMLLCSKIAINSHLFAKRNPNL